MKHYLKFLICDPVKITQEIAAFEDLFWGHHLLRLWLSESDLATRPYRHIDTCKPETVQTVLQVPKRKTCQDAYKRWNCVSASWVPLSKTEETIMTWLIVVNNWHTDFETVNNKYKILLLVCSSPLSCW